MSNTVYLKKHLLEALSKEGLPYSYSTLLKYERQGIIPKAKQTLTYNNSEWRTYTEREVKKIIKLIRKYRKGKRTVMT
jgi:hypothetical protein